MPEEIKVRGKLIRARTYGQLGWKNTSLNEEAEIILTLRELAEQMTHKQIGEFLELINLPHPPKKKKIERLAPTEDYWDVYGFSKSLVIAQNNKINQIIDKLNEGKW